MIALIAALFYNPIFYGKVFYYDDIEAWHYPQRHFQYEMGKAGKIFKWNPYIFCGQPYIADIQNGFFYPVNWLFFIVPPDIGIVFFILIHYLFSAFFSYCFLRRIPTEPAAALSGAIFYTFSSFAVLHTIHPGILAAYSLIPLGLILTDQLMENMLIKNAAILGVFIGIHVLIGSLQITFFLLLIITAYFIGRLNLKELFRPASFRLLSLFILAIFIAGMLCAVQVLPSLEFFRFCPRNTSVSFEDATTGSLHPEDMVMFLVPDYYGHPLKSPPFKGSVFFWEICFYVGIFPIMLAILAIFHVPSIERNRLWIFSFLLIFGIVLALGKYTPIYSLFYFTPFFKSFRIPARFLLLALISLAYLIALAINQLPGILGQKESKTRLKVIIPFFTLVVFIISLTVFFALKGKSGLSPGVVYFIVTGFLGSILVLLGILNILRPQVFKWVAVILLTVSAFSFATTWNPTVSRDYYKFRTQAFAKIAKRTPPVRVHFYPPLEFKESLNFPSTAGVSNICGYNPLALSWYLEYLIYSDFNRLLELEISRKLTAKGNIFNLYNPKGRMIRLLNIAGFYSFQSRSGELGVNFMPLKEHYPRAFLVKKSLTIKDKEKLLGGLRSGKYDPMEIVLFQEEPTPESPPPKKSQNKQKKHSGGSNEVKIIEFNPDRVTVRIDPSRASWLFLSEIYYPGWKAKVDGVERKIHRANYIFRAVQVFPGEQEAVFYFDPDLVKIGFIVSGISILLVAGLLFFSYIQR